MLDLQRFAGNRAVSLLIGAFGPVQREAALAPADTLGGFNPENIRNQLIRAIDSAQIKNPFAGPREWRRHIEFDDVVAVLSHLTAQQVDAVQRSYEDHEKRSIRNDIFGPGETHARSDLTHDELNRIDALLGGTLPTTPAPGAATAGGPAEHQREADAAELHALLFGDADAAQIEQAMTILRRGAAANAALTLAYERMYVTTLLKDIFLLPLPDAYRAMALLNGATVAADKMKVANDQGAIEGIDQEIKSIDDSRGILDPAPMVKTYQIQELRKKRKRAAEDIQHRAEQAAAEARAAAGGDDRAADQAATAGVAAVLGDVKSVAAKVGGPGAAVLQATAEAHPGAKAAAELHKLAAEGTLKPDATAAVLRSLRAEAAAEAAQRLPDGTEEQKAAKARTLTDTYFDELRSTWNGDFMGKAITFEQLMAQGDETEARRNTELAQGKGELDPVSELVLALTGDHKDLEAVKRVLHDKTAAELAQIRVQYQIRAGGIRTLDHDLMGDAPTTGDGTSDAALLAASPLGRVDKGKASGTDRLVLEDYLQRPQHEGGLEEVRYIRARAEREYAYSIEHRGSAGWWRDAWGNETRHLLDETIAEIRDLHGQYAVMVGWVPPNHMVRPEGATTAGAHQLIRHMRLARATIRNDRAGYEKENAKLQATFDAIATFVIQTAFTAVLGPLAELALLGEVAKDAALLLRVTKWAQSASVGVVATVGANLAVQGDDYSWAMLRHDLLTGYGGALGSHAADKLIEPLLGQVGSGLLARLGSKCPPGIRAEVQASLKTVGGVVGGDLAEGDLKANDFELRNLLKAHLGSKLGEKGAKWVTGHVEPTGKGSAGPESAGAEETPGENAPGQERAGPEGVTPEDDAGRMPSEERPAGAEDDTPTRESETPMAAAEPPAGAAAMHLDEPAGREASIPAGSDSPREASQGRESAAPRRAKFGLDYLVESTRPNQRTRTLAAELVPVFEGWKGSSPGGRRAQIQEIINRQLHAAGLTAVPVVAGPGGPASGAFTPSEFRITLSAEAFANDALSVSGFAELCDSAGHEARHALHHFRGIRAALADGEFVEATNVPEDVIEAARAANEPGSGAEKMSDEARGEALDIYRQTFGAGKAVRLEIISARNTARTALVEAQQRWDSVKADSPGSPMRKVAWRDLDAAQRVWRRAHNAYTGLPQETDAFRRGLAVGQAVHERIQLQDRLSRAEQSRERLARDLRVLYAGYEDTLASGEGEAAAANRLTRARSRLEAAEHHVGALRQQLDTYGQGATPVSPGAAAPESGSMTPDAPSSDPTTTGPAEASQPIEPAPGEAEAASKPGEPAADMPTMGTDSNVRAAPAAAAESTPPLSIGRGAVFVKQPRGKYKFLKYRPAVGVSKAFLVRDTETGKVFLFKPTRGQKAVARARELGIASAQYAGRTKATEIAAKALGIDSPGWSSSKSTASAAH